MEAESLIASPQKQQSRAPFPGRGFVDGFRLLLAAVLRAVGALGTAALRAFFLAAAAAGLRTDRHGEEAECEGECEDGFHVFDL